MEINTGNNLLNPRRFRPVQHEGTETSLSDMRYGSSTASFLKVLQNSTTADASFLQATVDAGARDQGSMV